MGLFDLAQKIASDTRCAQGGMMGRAAHIAVYLADYREEVIAEEHRRIIDSMKLARERRDAIEGLSTLGHKRTLDR